MNKKIIMIAVLLLAVVVVFAACKKDDEYEVDHTVKLENGDVVEVYKDEDGEKFITNVDGDEIPVTTDKDGFYDSIEDLITETATKKSDKTDDDKNTSNSKPSENKHDNNEPSSDEKKDEPSSSEEPSSNHEEPSSSQNNNKEPTSEASGIEIGNDTNKGGSIEWDDIVEIP